MLVRSAAYRWVGMIAEVGVGIVTTPLLLHHLGQSAYGIWLVVVSIAGVLSFLDLGLSSAVTTQLAAYMARGERDSVWNTVATGLTLYMAIAAVVGACYLVLAWWGAPLFNWGPEFMAEGPVLLMVMSLCVTAGFFNNLFEGIIIACEKWHLVGLIETCVALARLAAILLAIHFWGGLLAVGVAHTLVTVGGYVAIFILGRRSLVLEKPLRFAWDGGQARALLAYGRDSVLISIGMRLRQDGPVLLTSSLGGLVVVPFVGVSLRLLGYMISLVHLAVGVALPRFAALEGVQDRDHTQKLLLRATLYSFLLTTFMVLATAFLAGPFIRLWLGERFEPAVGVIWLLLGPMGLYMALRPCEVFLYGIGRHRMNGFLYLAETVVMAVLCLLTIGTWGIKGAAFSLGGSLLLFRPWLLPKFVCRQTGLGVAAFWLRGPARAALAGALAALPLAFLFRTWEVQSWFELVAAGVALTLVCGPIFWLAGLDAKERDFWRSQLTKMRRKSG